MEQGGGGTEGGEDVSTIRSSPSQSMDVGLVPTGALSNPSCEHPVNYPLRFGPEVGSSPPPRRAVKSPGRGRSPVVHTVE